LQRRAVPHQVQALDPGNGHALPRQADYHRLMLQTVEPDKVKLTKADRTRARLIEVAKRLYQEHGSDHVTVRRIAAAAKIEAGTISSQCRSRAEIMRAGLESGVGGAREEVMQAIADTGPDSSPLDRLRAALGAHLKYTLREHFSSRLRSIRRLPKRLRDRHMQQEREYAAIFANLLAEAAGKGLLRDGFDLSVVRMLVLGALTWTAEWFDPEGSMSPDDVAGELMAMLTTGVFRGSDLAGPRASRPALVGGPEARGPARD